MKRWYQRPFSWFCLLVLALALALFASVLAHDTTLERRFEGVKTGMAARQVIAALGPPQENEPCGTLGGSPGPRGGLPLGCSQELRYDPKIPSITAYVVFLDTQETVIGTYVYQSW
jgi:hypothetical protein